MKFKPGDRVIFKNDEYDVVKHLIMGASLYNYYKLERVVKIAGSQNFSIEFEDSLEFDKNYLRSKQIDIILE